MFPKFTALVSGTWSEIIYNYTTTIDIIHLKVLGVEKGEYGGVAMMLKTGIKLAQDYIFSNYVPPIPQNNIKSQDIMIVAGTGVNLSPIFSSREQ